MRSMDIKDIIQEGEDACLKIKASGVVLALPGQRETAASVTLYERLGGVFAIATVVDDFIDRIMDDPRINANPKVNEAHHKVARAGFKYLVTEQVCEATGGPQHYTGRSMVDSHVHLEITEQEWEVFRGDLRQTLDKFQVPGPEQKELLDIFESTKKDIVAQRQAT